MHLIFDALSRFVLHGPLEGDTPWGKLPKVRFICPVPGYDWHFGMLDTLGIECVPVEIGEDGPDMEEVERLALDPTVKGMICVPMYSNPTAVTFSDAVVDRLARMETAAGDFRLIWDNAYCVHHLYAGKRDRLKNIYRACVEAGNPDRPMLFTSTSKITFAGGGISAMAASPRNMERQRALLTYQCICYDKINQLRHARFLPDLGGGGEAYGAAGCALAPEIRGGRDGAAGSGRSGALGESRWAGISCACALRRERPGAWWNCAGRRA